MRASLPRVGALLAAALLGIWAMGLPERRDRDSEVVDAVRALDGEWVGRPAPSFELPDLSGTRHRLSDFRGEVVFVNFWASFCRPCRREMPSMEGLARSFADRDFRMLAITQDAERKAARGFVREFVPEGRSAMTFLWDPSAKVTHQFGTEKLPETYLVDRKGRIVARFVGEYDWSRPEAERLVEALLSR